LSTAVSISDRTRRTAVSVERDITLPNTIGLLRFTHVIVRSSLN